MLGSDLKGSGYLDSIASTVRVLMSHNLCAHRITCASLFLKIEWFLPRV